VISQANGGVAFEDGRAAAAAVCEGAEEWNRGEREEQGRGQSREGP
jgi:hypothetical protein